MSSERTTITLGEICLSITDGKHGDCQPNEDSGLYFLSAKDVHTGKLNYNGARQITSVDFHESHKRTRLAPLDVLITNSGTIGRMAIARDQPETYRSTFQKSVALLKPDQEKIEPFYLYYLLLADNDRLCSFAGGTTQKNLLLRDLRGFSVELPCIAEQREVSSTLRIIDDRIALLRDTNTTIETIAQVLFKSWFVDFDPVRAKLEGREPGGMDASTLALFPSSFDESEVGLVPTGWRVGKFGELAHLHKGSINPLNLLDTIFEHYSLPAFDNGQMPVNEAGAQIKSNKTSVPVGSVLLSKLNPHIPRIWLPSEVGKNAVCSTEFLAFVPVGSGSKEFIYCYFTSALFQQLLCQLVTGTSNSHQRVKPDAVSTMPVIIPLSDVLKSFELHTAPLLDGIKHNRQKAQTLATLRDTLLPRLISGQLRLPDVEALVGESAT